MTSFLRNWDSLVCSSWEIESNRKISSRTTITWDRNTITTNRSRTRNSYGSSFWFCITTTLTIPSISSTCTLSSYIRLTSTVTERSFIYSTVIIPWRINFSTCCLGKCCLYGFTRILLSPSYSDWFTISRCIVGYYSTFITVVVCGIPRTFRSFSDIIRQTLRDSSINTVYLLNSIRSIWTKWVCTSSSWSIKRGITVRIPLECINPLLGIDIL